MAEDDLNTRREEPVSDIDRDRKPGSSVNSAEYDRIYNPGNEKEYTNQLERHNELELQFLEQDARERYEQQLHAMASRCQMRVYHGVGNFIVPQDNSWVAHAELVDHGPLDLHFDPDRYPLFDKILAEKLRLPGLTDPNHPDYEQYEGLRLNLAVVRNYIFGSDPKLKDGSFDPGDETEIPKFIEIAEEIGKALNNDSWMRAVFFPSVQMEVANVPGEGAAEIYKHIAERQHNHNYFSRWYNAAMALVGLSGNDWQLVPLAQSPFSEEGLSAPSRVEVETMVAHRRAKAAEKEAVQQALVTKEPTPSQGTQGTTPLNTQADADKKQRINEAMKMAEELLAVTQIIESKSGKNKTSIAEMDDQKREDSIEEGREIIRRLKNLQSVDQSMETGIDQASPPQALDGALPQGAVAADNGQLEETADEARGFSGSGSRRGQQDRSAQRTVRQARKVAQIIEVYERYLDQAMASNPDVIHSQRVQEANSAIKEYVHSVKLMAALEIPNSISAAQQIGSGQAQDPNHWHDLHDRAVGRLVASIEGGVEDALDSMEIQQQDQEQDEELAQDAIEGALANSDRAKRRRRRRQQQKSGFGGKKQLKDHLALTADDFTLKQGKFSPQDERGQASPRVGLPRMALRMEDMADLAMAAASLRSAGDSGRELAASMASVSVNDKLTPDNQALSATQNLDNQRERGTRNPRRNNPRTTT